MARIARNKTVSMLLWMCLMGGGVAVGAGVFGLILASAQGADPEAYPDEISVEQVLSKKDSGALIVDVREPSEWMQFHIAGATHIPLGQLEKRANELPQDKEIIVVCRSGGRSATGRDILRKAGFKKVTSMAGGMNAWRAAGYPTASGQ
jgi:rhodanese-related sulfurtransferase